MCNAQSINTKLSIYSFIETIKRVSYIMIIYNIYPVFAVSQYNTNRKNRLDAAFKTYTYNNVTLCIERPPRYSVVCTRGASRPPR